MKIEVKDRRSRSRITKSSVKVKIKDDSLSVRFLLNEHPFLATQPSDPLLGSRRRSDSQTPRFLLRRHSDSSSSDEGEVEVATTASSPPPTSPLAYWPSNPPFLRAPPPTPLLQGPQAVPKPVTKKMASHILPFSDFLERQIFALTAAHISKLDPVERECNVCNRPFEALFKYPPSYGEETDLNVVQVCGAGDGAEMRAGGTMCGDFHPGQLLPTLPTPTPSPPALPRSLFAVKPCASWTQSFPDPHPNLPSFTTSLHPLTIIPPLKPNSQPSNSLPTLTTYLRLAAKTSSSCSAEQPILLPCSHVIGANCLFRLFSAKYRRNECPVCRKTLFVEFSNWGNVADAEVGRGEEWSRRLSEREAGGASGVGGEEMTAAAVVIDPNVMDETW